MHPPTEPWLDPDETRPCQGHDYLFFPSTNDPADVADAKALCADCPTRLPCLDHALTYEEAGIWGGTTQYERRKIRGRRGLLFHNPFRVVEQAE